MFALRCLINNDKHKGEQVGRTYNVAGLSPANTVLGDLDNDEYPEILLFLEDDNTFELWFTQNGVDVHRREPLAGLPSNQGVISITSIGDLDGNNRPDVFANLGMFGNAVGLLREEEFAFDWVEFNGTIPPGGASLALHPCSSDITFNSPIVLTMGDSTLNVFTFWNNGSVAFQQEFFDGELDHKLLAHGICSQETGFPEALVRRLDDASIRGLAFRQSENGSVTLANVAEVPAFNGQDVIVNALDYDHDGTTDFLVCATDSNCKMLTMKEESFYEVRARYALNFEFFTITTVSPVAYMKQPDTVAYSSVLIAILGNPLGAQVLNLVIGSLPKERNMQTFFSQNNSQVEVLPLTPSQQQPPQENVHLSLSSFHFNTIQTSSSSLQWATQLPLSTVLSYEHMMDKLELETSIPPSTHQLQAITSSLQVTYNAVWLHHPSLVDGYSLNLDDVKISFAMEWSPPLTQAFAAAAASSSSIGCAFEVKFTGKSLTAKEGELRGESDVDEKVKRYVFGMEEDGKGSVVKVGMAINAFLDGARMEEVEQTAFVVKEDLSTILELRLKLPPFNVSLLYDPDFSVLFGAGEDDGGDGDGDDGYDDGYTSSGTSDDGANEDDDEEKERVLSIVLPAVLVPLFGMGAIVGVVIIVLWQKRQTKVNAPSEMQVINY
ncbi:hypothetical protein QOT17_005076 [Balamuthia mandrillaris]